MVILDSVDEFWWFLLVLFWVTQLSGVLDVHSSHIDDVTQIIPTVLYQRGWLNITVSVGIIWCNIGRCSTLLYMLITRLFIRIAVVNNIAIEGMHVVSKTKTSEKMRILFLYLHFNFLNITSTIFCKNMIFFFIFENSPACFWFELLIFHNLISLCKKLLVIFKKWTYFPIEHISDNIKSKNISGTDKQS